MDAAVQARTGHAVSGLALGVAAWVLLGVGAVITIVAGIVEFVIWFPYDNGILELAVWAALASVPSVVICLLLGLAWAFPVLLASIGLAIAGTTRASRTRVVPLVALLVTILPACVSLAVVIFLLGIGAAPWSLPPGR